MCLIVKAETAKANLLQFKRSNSRKCKVLKIYNLCVRDGKLALLPQVFQNHAITGPGPILSNRKSTRLVRYESYVGNEYFNVCRGIHWWYTAWPRASKPPTSDVRIRDNYVNTDSITDGRMRYEVDINVTVDMDDVVAVKGNHGVSTKVYLPRSTWRELVRSAKRLGILKSN